MATKHTHKKSNTKVTQELTNTAKIWIAVTKWIFLLSYILLGYLFFMDISLQAVGGIILFDFILAILYWISNSKYILTFKEIESHMRYIMSYIITIMTITFYAIAMTRSDQMNDTVKLIIIVVGIFVWYAIYLSAKGFLSDLMKNKQAIEEAKN